MAGLLSERAQKLYLIVTGLIVFFLSAQLLELKSETVPVELQVYHWPQRIEGAPYPIRVLAKDRVRKQLIPAKFCGDNQQLAEANQSGPDLPLDLRLKAEQTSPNLCLQAKGTLKRTLELSPPQPMARDQLTSYWELAMGQSQSHPTGYTNFPIGFLILPDGGSFNPRSTAPFFRLWMAEKPAQLHWVDKEKKEHLVEANENGFYEIPLRLLLLQGKARVVATTTEGMRYPMDVSFRGISRDVAVEAQMRPQDIQVRVRALAIPGQKRSKDTQVYCSLFAGNAPIKIFHATISPETDHIERLFPLTATSSPPLAIQCNTTPLGMTRDSAWAWVLPEPGKPGFSNVQSLASRSLPDMIGDQLSDIVTGWSKSNDPQAQKRFLEVFSSLVIPKGPEAILEWSSLPDDLQVKRSQYQSQKIRLIVVVVVLFLTWLLACVLALQNLKRARIQSLYELSLEGSLDELPDTPAGGDALERPQTRFLSTIVLFVTVLAMTGLLWVLTSF